MRIASTDGQTVIADNGQEYHPDAAGIFTVPDELGAQLVKFPHWVAEADAPPAEHVGKHEAAVSHESRIAKLEAHVEALLAKVEELTPKSRRAKAADAEPAATE